MASGAVFKRILDSEAGVARLARRPDPSIVGAVVIGLGATAVSLLLRWGLSGFYGSVTGFMILLPGVILAALAGGRIAGLTATAASLLGGWLVVGPSGFGVGIMNDLARVATVNFIIVGVFITEVAVALRRAISGLEHSDRRLSESESRFRLLSEQAPAMLWMSDTEGRCVHLNAAQRAFWGVAPDLSGFEFATTVHADDKERLRAVTFKAMADHAPLEIEARSRRHDGEWRILRTKARPRFSPDGVFEGLIGVNTDVTDSRAAEAALRESEERFRLMADTAPSPVWLTNAEAEVEFVNEALVEFYGLPRDQILGHVWKLGMHPEDLDAVAAVQAESRPRRLPYGFEARFRHADGGWRWMRVAVKPRMDVDGTFLGYVGMSFDITDARTAIAALERQERRQTFLLKLADTLRALDDPDSIMAEVERALGAELGAARVGYGEVDQARGVVSMTRDWTAGVASAEGEFSLDAFGADLITDLAAGRSIRIRDVRRDRRTRAVADAFAAIQTRSLMRAPVIRGGRLRAFLYVHATEPRDWSASDLALLEDVAARTWAEIENARAQAELRESESRFRDVADTAPVLIWVTREDRQRDFVNQAYVAFMGGDYESVRTADWRSYVHAEDQERLVRESLAGEATGQPFSLEARYLRHDGEYRWLRSFSRPRLGPGGAVIGFVGVAFDVTDSTRVEADLKRINELLEERVGEALAEKAKAEADLMHAQRMEAVGRLTGGVAHDFNNLLTVVIGALDMMLRSEDPARSRKLAEAALSAARRGEGLTHQLLAFSRRQALRPEAVDLNALIRESEPLLRRAVGEAVDFRRKLKRGGAWSHVDAAQFEAALLNLVVNARDAVGDKGAIRVTTDSCEVGPGEVRDLAPGDYVCVTVSDNGQGMTPEVMSRVFEPFYTTKAVGKGTGLGLSQVYGFARQSGGGVDIVSAPGEGAQVRLYLPPLDPGARAPAPEPLAAATTPVSGGRILLVEDDPGVSQVAFDLLTELGLEVRAVDSGPAALQALEAERFDLMLTDIVMPGGMTGVELARRAARAWPAMRIVLTSGYAGDDVDDALGDAPWPFLRKPYSRDQLRRQLDDSLHPVDD